MHETAIAQSLVEEVEKALTADGARGLVKRVHLRVGRLTAVVPDMLEFAFQAITPGTRLEGAALTMDLVEVQARCRACQAENEVLDIGFYCASCGSPDLEVQRGRELFIDYLEVEENDP